MNSFQFEMENEQGNLVVKGEIFGQSDIPSLDDLKFRAVIALLNSIDKKNFSDAGQEHLFKNYINEIEETITEMKKYDRFQGR